MGILYVIIIGAVCGWLAGNIMKGGGFGILINIILGIVGSFVGHWLFGMLNIAIGSGGVVNDIVTGLAGAIVVLLVAGLFKK